jgi:chorismate mutase
MRELMQRNGLEASAMVSCIFTLTDDLDAEFPAVAARRLGLDRVPLLCAREVPVPGALPRVIRALVHYYADAAHEPRHVYLGEARALRADLESAQ